MSRLRILSVLGVLLAAAPAAVVSAAQMGPGEQEDSRFWVIIRAAGPSARTAVASAGVSIEEIKPETVAGIASPGALARVQRQGFSVVSELPLAIFLKSFPPADRTYHDYAAVQAELGSIVAGSGGLASLVSLGQSLEGRNITAVRFNASARGQQPSDKPGLLLVGSHHAREHLSTEVPLLLARWLSDHRAEPAVRGLLETRDIFILPLLNPDGSEYDIATGQYRFHRKNTRHNADGSIGVDLNRNYDSHWCETGSSHDPQDETYCGGQAFSEPESQAMRDFILARPNLRAMISYHTFDEMILYPWSWGPEPLSDARALRAFEAMGKQMAQWTGYESQQSAALYSSSGDTCDWAWAERKIFCFTFELGPKTEEEGGFYPGPGLIAPSVQKNIQPLLYLAELANDPYRAAAAVGGSVAVLPILPGFPLSDFAAR